MPGDGRQSGEPGFSLIELVVALAVAGLLLAATGPSFVSMLRDNRLTTRINMLLADVHLARTEAITRHRDVVICRSRDGRSCHRSSGPRADWSGGWIVYVNTDGNKTRDPGEPLLRARPPLTGDLRLRFNRWWRLIYHPDGSASNASYTLCDRRGPRHARALVVFYTGRPRISGRRADGKLLDCG